MIELSKADLELRDIIMRDQTSAVYIAASSAEIERAEYWIMRARAIGIRVTSNWVENIRRVAAERLAGDVKEAANPRVATRADRASWAQENVDNILKANLFWLLMPDPERPSQGAYYEMGTARQARRRCIATGTEAAQRFVFSALAHELEIGDEHGLAWLVRHYLTVREALDRGWHGEGAMTPPWVNASWARE